MAVIIDDNQMFFNRLNAGHKTKMAAMPIYGTNTLKINCIVCTFM